MIKNIKLFIFFVETFSYEPYELYIYVQTYTYIYTFIQLSEIISMPRIISIFYQPSRNIAHTSLEWTKIRKSHFNSIHRSGC